MVTIARQLRSGTNRIRNSEFGIRNAVHPASPFGLRRDKRTQTGPTVVAIRSASSTVDPSQSASNAIYHSYLSESLAGRSPSWLSEGGWAGGGGGKNGVRGRPSARMQPAGAPKARSGRGRRHRRELALGGSVGRGRVAAVEDRGRRAGTGGPPWYLLLSETELIEGAL